MDSVMVLGIGLVATMAIGVFLLLAHGANQRAARAEERRVVNCVRSLVCFNCGASGKEEVIRATHDRWDHERKLTPTTPVLYCRKCKHAVRIPRSLIEEEIADAIVKKATEAK